VVASVLGRQLSEGEKRHLRLDFWNSLSASAKNDAYGRAVEKGDQKTWGAPKVLVDAGVARYVDNRNDLKPGDVLQYHWKAKDGSGSQRGHVGVVAADSQGRVIVERDTTQGKQRGILLVSAHSAASAIEAWEKKHPGEGEPIGTRFVPLSEIQQFKAARMIGGAADSARTAPQGQTAQPLNSDTPVSSPNVENTLSRIRRGDNSSYIREGSSGPEVVWLKDQLLKWAVASGKVPASERAVLARTASSDKMTSEWTELMAKFQTSVGLNDDGTLNRNPKNGEQLAADRVWGIRSQRALDLFFGRETTPEFQAVSWDEFKKITDGIWSQAHLDAAGYGASDEEVGPGGIIDGSGIETSRSPKKKMGNVEIEPQVLIKRGIAKNFGEARNIIAFLGAISVFEGTAGDNGYRTMFGGGTFNDMSRHPDRVISSGGYNSAAAGKYQFMPATYASIGMKNMEPITQDLGAIALLARRGVLDNVKRGDWAGALRGGAAAEWASLPTGPGDSRGQYRQINDSGRYQKVLAAISRFQNGVDEMYSESVEPKAS
jgi:muramidase (phage lysozyme)